MKILLNNAPLVNEVFFPSFSSLRHSNKLDHAMRLSGGGYLIQLLDVTATVVTYG